MSMEPYFRPPVRELRWIAAFAFAVLVPTATSAQNVGTIRVSKDKAYYAEQGGSGAALDSAISVQFRLPAEIRGLCGMEGTWDDLRPPCFRDPSTSARSGQRGMVAG